MTLRTFSILLISFILFQSCNYAEKQRQKYEEEKKQRENPTEKKTYWDNGKLKSFVPLKDSKYYHGVGKNYYKNGQLQSTLNLQLEYGWEILLERIWKI